MRTDGGSGLTSPVMNTEETPLIPPRKRSVQKDTHSSGSSSAGRASGGRTESSASSGFNAPEVWKDKDQSPKNFQEYASVFLVSLRNQSKIHFTLSLLYHLIHIALILSFVFSPILTRSVTFSSSSMSHRLLQAQGIIAPKSSDADSANKDKPPTPVVDSTKYAIESVWSIHDGLFFLEPGHAIVPVSIEESFQKLPNTKKKKRKGKNELNGGKKEDNKGSNSNQGDDDDDEDNNQNEHTYVTEDTVEEATDNGVSQLLAGGKVFTYASPAPIVSNGRHWKKKGKR
ncbi:hypothetical protein AGDE_14392 [Angomonas deanei]|uniref:Uncharacterized protein n=1 Tax=Angomonas deanei TaxID=59799 RepID=A0A7G2CLP5_9TRYP|nr:hypothetical protein AGDE_14392 [Angomonas deanei]CAD2219841.1 hypothetical protein, conserved [Angomonas deanei]|eukprot:EPY20932.1 hypothetical protein AGDE_14392 [Angomonas deanei]